jgi:hypothetical protein
MRTRFRKPLLYPLSYGGRATLCPPARHGRIRSVSDSAAIAGLLHEAAETHHVVYRIVDGDDPDWASWYADWLLTLSELPALLGAPPVRSHLVSELVGLDREYSAESREQPWEDWYAERLLERFRAG